MEVVLVAFEDAGADLQEGDAVAVVGIHVGVDLEDEARHFGFGGLYRAGFGLRGAGRGGDADEAFEQLSDAEVVDRRAEEDRSQFAAQIGFAVEFVVDALDQFDILAQLVGILFADVVVQHFRREIRDLDR